MMYLSVRTTMTRANGSRRGVTARATGASPAPTTATDDTQAATPECDLPDALYRATNKSMQRNAWICLLYELMESHRAADNSKIFFTDFNHTKTEFVAPRLLVFDEIKFVN